MSEQNRRLRAAGIAALAWAGLAAVWCVLVPGGAAELPQGDARQEAAHVKNARERAQEAAQPE